MVSVEPMMYKSGSVKAKPTPRMHSPSTKAVTKPVADIREASSKFCAPSCREI